MEKKLSFWKELTDILLNLFILFAIILATLFIIFIMVPTPHPIVSVKHFPNDPDIPTLQDNQETIMNKLGSIQESINILTKQYEQINQKVSPNPK